ncbi:unnamed protein product [Urochloa decumbens]|uniref:KIB1-4 beta-propeller domain-containing protein n=1 Tax=Urochloa decumbens TaxID=240449 RepID=A0ABC9D864_9POAL
MVGSSRRRTLRRRRANGGVTRRSTQPAPGMDIVDRLPPELLTEIHSHLGDADFLKRLAFASVCGASGHMFKQEAPCLVLAGADGADHEEAKARVFSLAARRAAAVRAPDPAMRGHVVVGSSGGWLVTADAMGTLRMVNPVTGAQADLPAITTGSIPFLAGGGNWRFCLDVDAFRRIRSGGAYAAMLILARTFGSPAFATSSDPAWRLAAPSRDGVEDAIHHRGQFYSISRSGAVEAWARDGDTGEFTSTTLAAGVEEDGGDGKLLRRYLAVAPDGRLMAVAKHSKEVRTRVFFTVMVLDEARRRWEEAAGIGSSALFVGVNASVCVPVALEYRGIRPNCIYFTDHQVVEAYLCNEHYREENNELREVGVYSLKHRKVDEIVGLGKHQRWPPPAWFTPSFL